MQLEIRRKNCGASSSQPGFNWRYVLQTACGAGFSISPSAKSHVGATGHSQEHDLTLTRMTVMFSSKT